MAFKTNWKQVLKPWMEGLLGMQIEDFELDDETAFKQLVIMSLKAIYNDDPNLLGGPETEPRQTWDQGGSIADGHAAYWGT